MACKRSAVRSRLGPPFLNNPPRLAGFCVLKRNILEELKHKGENGGHSRPLVEPDFLAFRGMGEGFEGVS